MFVYQSPDRFPEGPVCSLMKASRLFGQCTVSGRDTDAFSSDDTLTLSVSVPRAFCAFHVSLRLYADDDGSVTLFPLSFAEMGASSDLWEITLALPSLCREDAGGLFYYGFLLETPYGTLRVGKNGRAVWQDQMTDDWQLLVYDAAFSTPENFRGGMMYQIFVDRFSDGGRPIAPGPGQSYEPDWENGIPEFAEVSGGFVKNTRFFGGNLWGVAEKLDYIKSLGVDTVYLCPIFEAKSNHKYDTGDYEKIDRMFGGEEAFDHLIREMNKRGMKLILDGVFNHTGDDSRYFNRYGHYPPEGACDTKESPFYDWYDFEDYPSRYRSWWGVEILPAVRGTSPTFREFLCGENGVIRRYLKRGIAGWRLDVADELDSGLLDGIRKAVKAENPDALLLGEVWEDASDKISYGKRRRYFRGHQLDSVMNYPLKEALISYLLSGDATRLKEVSKTLYAHYPRKVSHVLMNFLGTHDTERILTVLADVGSSSMSNKELSYYRLSPADRFRAVEKLKLAWALLCAFPGIPCIYYGDEAGMEGGRDPFNRMPYPWGREDKALTSFYRRIGAIRREEPDFRDGDFRLLETGDKGQLLFTRGEHLLIAANLTDRVFPIAFDEGIRPERLIGREECGEITEIAPMSVEYFRI